MISAVPPITARNARASAPSGRSDGWDGRAVAAGCPVSDGAGGGMGRQMRWLRRGEGAGSGGGGAIAGRADAWGGGRRGWTPGGRAAAASPRGRVLGSERGAGGGMALVVARVEAPTT